jgi:hypothetical protein
MLKGTKVTGNPVQAYLSTLPLSQIVGLQKEVDAALEQCEDSNRHMAVYRGGDDLARRIRAQCFDKDKIAQRPHKMSDSLHRLHERLGCHSQHSIPIGFYYAKWSEKLIFHLSNLRKQERSHSSASPSRSRTPSPRIAVSTRSAGDPTRSLDPPEQHLESPTMASSSAAPNTYPALHPRDAKYYMEQDAKYLDTKQKIEEAEAHLNDIREKRAAIFDDTKDKLLKMEQKSVFRYRQARLSIWRGREDTMIDVQEWNDRYDREQLEKLQKEEEQLEMLLAKLAKSIGYGPAGQGFN